MNKILAAFNAVRQRSETICASLEKEDYVVQPVEDVSPPKWHLGHTTWFFETFLLKENLKGYKEYNASYNYVFNSYYETIGARVIRTDRGNLSRPSVGDVYQYRKYIDNCMNELLSAEVSQELQDLVTLGLNHEEQHQELLATDIKYILGHNPLFPGYTQLTSTTEHRPAQEDLIQLKNGMYDIGHTGPGFCFDNELERHSVYLQDYSIASELVTNEEYLEFVECGGYGKHEYWHAEGLGWVKTNDVRSPLYWHMLNGRWHHYTPSGLEQIPPQDPVCHVSFYEASAYAAWKGLRLPTEFEWEAAASKFDWGERWEWTNSAYLPYPGFKRAAGAIGEYNGKFMVNQMVLRGASMVTSPGHSRMTYRNFFHPHLRWQFTGIRLAR